jgi:metallophosphoesterase (TIGR00282 family)
MPKILFIGDIVAKPGRNIVDAEVNRLRAEKGIDIVIANAENAAGGSGLTSQLAHEILGMGVDGITLGDHVWDQRSFPSEIDSLEKVCRPANLPPGVPGRKFLIIEKNGFKLGVLTLLGRNFMKVTADCPFRCIDEMLPELNKQTDAVMVEIHAETTAEKTAMGWYDGRVSMVLGTHTHIPTADGTILPRGTAYLTDAGMTGPYASCLGREAQPVILRMIDGMPRKFDIANRDVRLCGCIVDVDPASRMAVKFEQVIIFEKKE